MVVPYRLRVWTIGVVLTCLSGATYGQTRPAEGSELDDARVLEAVNKGVKFLYKDLDENLARAAYGVRDGGMEAEPGSVPAALGVNAGSLMLEAYALFSVAQELKLPELSLREQRMGALKEVVLGWSPPKGYEHDTYTTALQALALSQLPRLPEVDLAMKRVGQRLIGGMNARGGYTYSLTELGGNLDQSNSQYGLLGVWAAAEWGVPVPQTYWQISSAYWRRIQQVNGGWGYTDRDKPNAAMTAAGVASLYVCNDYTERAARLDMQMDAPLERGLAALTLSFDPANNDLYYLYALERVGLAGGHKYLGKRNWYRETALDLLRRQGDDGAFNSAFNGYTAPRATAFAILYLIRGRAPVVMNKLEYPGGWDLRPRDSANVHTVLSRTFERRLNWQSVPFDVDVDEWMDAPILLITGAKDPQFTDEQVEKLRAYVDRGGMIFSVAAGSNLGFSDAMQGYATRVVSGAQMPADPSLPTALTRRFTPGWRELPGTHPLFKVMEASEPLPPLIGMSNGVREVWVHSDTDLGATWQQRIEGRKAAWDIPARLFIYAAGKEGLRSRLHPPVVARPKTPPAATITMARLQYRGNWDPEPGAWPRMAKLLALEAHTGITVGTVAVEDLANLPQAQRPKLAHLAGTGPLALGEQGIRALREYLVGGGTLFVEAVGGDKTFAKDARELLARIVPQTRLRPIPRDYLLYTGGFSPNGARIGVTDYRRTAVEGAPRDADPRLEFLTLNNRLAVVFSDQDVTHGLLGFNTAGVSGYTPIAAQALARNILLFADINQRP